MPALKVPDEMPSRRPNGPANGNSKKPMYDPNFTDRVIAATGPKAHARMAEVMPSLVRHLHDFAREVDLTVAEWMAAVEFINAAGQMSDDRRNETQLVCDILGLETLVDEISSSLLQRTAPDTISVTSSAILGPFYRQNAPILPNGSDIASPDTRAAFSDQATHLSGRVLDSQGRPIVGAVVDVWHTAPNGMYEQQDPDQPDYNLRGRFETDGRGEYALYCLRPGPYPIPDDGPSGKLLRMLDRHPWRPAHIHVIIHAEGYRTLTTQLFDGDDKYLKDDTVFAVKRDLVANFVPREGDPKASWTLEYDFVLSKA